MSCSVTILVDLDESGCRVSRACAGVDVSPRLPTPSDEFSGLDINLHGPNALCNKAIAILLDVFKPGVVIGIGRHVGIDAVPLRPVVA